MICSHERHLGTVLTHLFGIFCRWQLHLVQPPLREKLHVPYSADSAVWRCVVAKSLASDTRKTRDMMRHAHFRTLPHERNEMNTSKHSHFRGIDDCTSKTHSVHGMLQVHHHPLVCVNMNLLSICSCFILFQLWLRPYFNTDRNAISI